MLSTPLWPIKVGQLPTVIDLSHNNPHLNTLAEFTALAKAGVKMVIHKAGQIGMKNNKDPMYDIRRSLAVTAGLKWDAYWFCDASDIHEQEEAFLTAVGTTNGKMRLCVDAEQNKGSTINPQQAANLALALDKRLGRQVIRYGNTSVPEYSIPAWRDGPMWWAKYGPEPTVQQMEQYKINPANVIMWQETGTGRMAGQSMVDLSYYRGDIMLYPELPAPLGTK